MESKNKSNKNTTELHNNITTIHGVSNLKEQRNRNIWYILMLANILITVAYLIIIKNKYNNDHIVTRINANCKINQVPFPSVTICNVNLVSNKRSKTIADILKSNNITQSQVELFLQNLPDLKEYRKLQDNQRDFSKELAILKRHYFTVESIMEEVHQTCEDLLLHCSFNRKTKDCSELFRLIKTYEGHCCAFNYAALNDDTVDAADDDDDIERYDDESENEQSSNIIVTSESGRGSGLGVVLNVEPNDYGNWSLVPFYGAKILVCDPNDYPEVTVPYKYVGIGVSLDIKVQPIIFQSDDEIRRIEVEKRGCIFHDEGLLEHTDRYSSETCISECRMKMFLTNCGCIPYKYPKERETRICEFKDLECLNKFRARGMVLDDCTQVCYMECRDKRYAITSDVMPLVPDFHPYDIIKDHNMSQITTLQVYFDKSTCNCYKQMLLMDFSYFIATYGGIFSLSFGASLVTCFEIFYLFASFLMKYVWKSIKEK